ncbi:MAG: hypothetical protein AB199_04055 [Parcubacteria bacterium C7867-004]|nr:MAG: hypothetical protein AB199_04055 [Parcubacteria bacterium C7867-004]
MTEALQDASWGGDAFIAVSEARLKAIDERATGNLLSSHTVILSGYITGMNQIRAGYGRLSRSEKLKQLLMWGAAAEWHSWHLRANREQLDHNQLNVLATWLLATASLPRCRWRAPLALRYARLGQAAAKGVDVLPHQRALAYLLSARAVMRSKYGDKSAVRRLMGKAHSLEAEIRAEANQPYGLRQLVRIFKGEGELHFELGDVDRAYYLFKLALAVAEGEADTKSQARQIELLLLSDAFVEHRRKDER